MLELMKRNMRNSEEKVKDRILASIMCWAIMEEEELPLVGVVPGVAPVTESLPQPRPPGGLAGVENPLPHPGV